jgi:dihydrofolate reductase
LLPFDGGAFDSYNLERIRAADIVLLGANSYAAFSGYWPAVADDSSAPRASREFARIYNEVEKMVVSDSATLPEADHPWAGTTRVLSRTEAHKTLAELKRQDGREIVSWGSRALWHNLMANGLVDELHLMVGAVPVGDGVPVFGSRRPALRLIDSQVFDGSDDVLLRYRVSE